MSDLRAGFSSEIKRVMRERDLSVAKAAAMLGVSRQAFYAYLGGTTLPRRVVFARAIGLWAIQVRIGDQILNKADFEPPTKPKPVIVAKQLDLFAVLDAIQQTDLRVAVKRVGKELRVSVQIEIPA